MKMNTLLVFVCVTSIFFAFTHCGTFYKRREEFSRIQRYELIHFETDALEQRNVLAFDAFDHHYEVELIRNDALNPAHIRHANINPAHHSNEQPFTSLTESCHFNGRVLHTAQPSLVSITMCRTHGVQGHIKVWNESTLWIYPSAYYLNATHTSYRTSDEHLVWRQSDLYRDPDAPAWHRGGVQVASDDLHPMMMMNADVDADVDARRSLSAYNDGANEIELFLLIGPVRYNRYMEEAERSGVDWYETLVKDIYTLIADVSTRYASAAWGTHIGALNFNFVELEVVFEFSGRYASMTPQWYYSNCADLRTCNVNGDSLLANLREWILTYKDQSSYDTAHFLMDILPEPQNLGKAYVASVCTTNGYGIGYSADISDDYIEFVKTVAHELGHNFNMSHDGMDNACDRDLYIMGYGEGTDSFSPCSVAELQSFFSEREGLECLGSAVQPLRSNADSSGRKLTPSPTAKPTVHCYEIDGLQFGAGNDWNGVYFDDGVSGGYPYYAAVDSSSNNFYLSYGKNEGVWCITRSIGSCRSNYGYCSKTTDELLKCTEWTLGSSVAAAVTIQDCDAPVTTSTSTTTTTTTSTTTTSTLPTAPTLTTTATTSTSQPSSSPTVQTTSTTTTTTTSTTTATAAVACVSISNLPAEDGGSIDYSVEWTAQGSRNGYPYYTNAALSDRYLCHANAVWCITTTLCQCDYRSLIAQCTNPTDVLLECDNFWLRASTGWGGTYHDNVAVTECSDDEDDDQLTLTPTAASSSTTTAISSTSTTSSSTVSLPQCVYILGLERARNATDLNGEWTYFGDITWTMNGQDSSYPVYVNVDAVDGTQRLLCFTPAQQRWFIAPYESSSSSACEYERRYAQCNQFGVDLLACQDLWRVYSDEDFVDFVDDLTVSVYDCALRNDDGAFSFADMYSECVSASNLSTSICLSSSSSELWNGSKTFSQYPNIACANQKPIFYHTIVGGDDDDDEQQLRRIYLHYFQFASNAKWIISYDSISVNGVAECGYASLLQCETEHAWTVIVHDGDAIKFSSDESISVSLGACLDGATTKTTKTDDVWLWWLCGVVGVCLVVLIGIACYKFVMRSKMKTSISVQVTLDDYHETDYEQL